MKNNLERTGECAECGECCQKMRITSILSNIIRQHGNINEAKNYYSFRGIRIADVSEKQDRVLLEVDLPCSQLTKDNKCLLHGKDEQPLICKKYPWFEDDIESCGYSFKKKSFW